MAALTGKWRRDMVGGARRRLEEDIDRLRRELHQAAAEHRSFTTDVVIRISRILDDKINEYMAQTR